MHFKKPDPPVYTEADRQRLLDWQLSKPGSENFDINADPGQRWLNELAEAHRLSRERAKQTRGSLTREDLIFDNAPPPKQR